MNNPDISTTAKQFTLAAASYFGVPADQLVTAKHDGSFVLVLRIALTPQDVTSIGVRMAEMGKDAEQFQPDGLAGTWQERTPDPESMAVFEHVSKSDQYTIEKAHEAFAGVGGRKVQHVDVPEQQDAVSELPAAVWVASDELSQAQTLMASDYRDDSGGRVYLIQVDMLTPEQKAKYCGASQDAVSELPAAVWLRAKDVEPAQSCMISDTRGKGYEREVLLQVALLTPEQKAKYGVQS